MRPITYTLIGILLSGYLLTVAPAASVGDSQKASPSQESSAAAREHYQKGLDHQILNERGAAREAFQAAIEADPDFIPAHKSYIVSAAQDLSKLKKEYEEKLKTHPNRAAYHLALGYIHLLQRAWEPAEKEFRKAVEIDPNSPWTHFYLGEISQRTGTAETILAEYKRASELGKDIAEIHATLASNYSRMKQFELARQESERALNLDPKNVRAYLTKWKAQMNLGQASEATKAAVREEVDALAEAPGGNPVTLIIAKRGYDILEDTEQSKKMEAAIRQIKPNWGEKASGWKDLYGKPIKVSSDLMMQIVGVHHKIETDPAEALKILKELEAKTSDESVKRWVLGPWFVRAYLNQGDLESGEKRMDDMKDLEPKRKHSLEEALAQVYADKKVKLDNALAIAQASVARNKEFKPEIKPDFMSDAEWEKFGSEAKQLERHRSGLSRSYDLLGWVQLQRGSPADAEESLTRSLSLDRTESNVFHMAMLKRQQGISDALDLFIEAYGYGGPKKEEAKKYAQELHARLTGPKEDLEVRLAEALETKKAKKAKNILAAEGRTQAPKTPAVDFTLANLQGAKIKLSDLRGKVVLLNFWATW